MTGGLSVATPIAPNANGEYIVNSSTGDGEVSISGGTRNIFNLIMVKNLLLKEMEKFFQQRLQHILDQDH